MPAISSGATGTRKKASDGTPPCKQQQAAKAIQHRNPKVVDEVGGGNQLPRIAGRIYSGQIELQQNNQRPHGDDDRASEHGRSATVSEIAAHCPCFHDVVSAMLPEPQANADIEVPGQASDEHHQRKGTGDGIVAAGMPEHQPHATCDANQGRQNRL